MASNSFNLASLFFVTVGSNIVIESSPGGVVGYLSTNEKLIGSISGRYKALGH